MIWFGVVLGAFLGLVVGVAGTFGYGFQAYPIVLGAILGGAAGAALQAAIRKEVDAYLKSHPALQAPQPRRDAEEIERIYNPANSRPAPPPPGQTGTTVPITETAPPRPEPVPAANPSDPPPILHKPPPQQVNAIDEGIEAARAWLFGGNTIVRAGLVILFIGLSFLARWAAQHDLFPAELRLALVTLVGTALLGFGYSRRESRPAFALALQGTGIAAIYLALFAGARLFHVIPPLAAFGLMVVVCALGCALAILQNAQPLALAAFVGGFAVPILLSDGSGNSLILFGYYGVLNLAVLAIAHLRAWRLVNLVGFFATFGVATAWGVLSYKPAEYAMAQPFLIGFVLNYIVAALLYARNTASRLTSFVDSTLLFGPALVGFGLQVGLVRHMPMGSAYSALGFGAAYLALVFFARRKGYGQNPLLAECLLAIALGFLTLAIPLALGAKWTSAAWAIEGAGAFWVGSRQARWMPRLFGLILQAVAAVVYLGAQNGAPSTAAVLNPAFLGALLVAMPVLAVAWLLRKPLPHSGSRFGQAYANLEARLSPPVFLVGFGFWLLALGHEIGRTVAAPGVELKSVFDYDTQGLLLMLAFVLSAAGAAVFGRRFNWRVATWPAKVTLVPIFLALVSQTADGNHVLYTPNWAFWLVAWATHYATLYAGDNDPQTNTGWQRVIHVGSVWTLTLWLADCLFLGIDRAHLWGTSWAQVVMLVSASLVLAAMTLTGHRALKIWPFNKHASAYYWVAAWPLVACVFFGALICGVVDPGQAKPLPYIPVINPLELALGLALTSIVFWRQTMLVKAPKGSEGMGSPVLMGVFAALAFILVSTVWLRIAHHFLQVPWFVDDLMSSFIVQTGLAILWTSLALALMVLAHRRLQRTLWLVGAGLLALVVVKLLLVDLANAGGGERVVTFMAVGVLMLITGYFAPLPPAAPKKEETQ